MMAKLNFQQQLLQSPLSRDPLEILLNLEHFLLWSCGKQLCCLIFLWKRFFFFKIL